MSPITNGRNVDAESQNNQPATCCGVPRTKTSPTSVRVTGHTAMTTAETSPNGLRATTLPSRLRPTVSRWIEPAQSRSEISVRALFVPDEPDAAVRTTPTTPHEIRPMPLTARRARVLACHHAIGILRLLSCRNSLALREVVRPHHAEKHGSATTWTVVTCAP